MGRKLDDQMVRESLKILKSAEMVFGRQHQCSRNNLKYRVTVHADQERKGRSISMSRVELSVLKYRAEAAGMTVSQFVRAVCGINPPTSAHCACGTMAEEVDFGEKVSVDELWAKMERRQPLRRDYGYGFDEEGNPFLSEQPEWALRHQRLDADDEEEESEEEKARAAREAAAQAAADWMPPSAEEEDAEYEAALARGEIDEDEDDEEDDEEGVRRGAALGAVR